MQFQIVLGMISKIKTAKHKSDSMIQVCNFIKKRLWHRCFPVINVKFLRAPDLKNICKWLL